MLQRRTVLLAALAGVSARSRYARADEGSPPTATPGGAVRTHGLSMLGEPALPPDFAHFPYANPNAPKGGEVALSAVGTFDSFNPYIIRGTAPADIGRIYDALLIASADEAATTYGHLAEVIEIPEDRMWVAFELRPKARFHDGKPVTAEDVVWTFNTLRELGRPFYRQYYADVESVTAENPRRAVFRFKSNNNRELPQILGEMAILPKHWWQGRDFTQPLTEPPLGSGPYRVGHFEFGRTMTFRRVPDWWAADLPTGRGFNNFDVMRTEYFRDATVALEAFKAGQIDFRQENVAKDWATGYGFPAVQKGLVKREEVRHRLPTGMQGFAMNARRPTFKDPRVRQALAWSYDFEWANKNLFYDSYTRTTSYFSNSDLASGGLPIGDELALLEPFRDTLPPSLFTEEFKLPVTDGSGSNREQLTRALALLKEAGWEVKKRQLVNAAGTPMSFEILLNQPAFERVSLPYVQNLARLGITARVRTVDPAQYQRLMDSFDFDMTVAVFGESESPGNEQVGYWSCDSAGAEGSDNLMGVCSKATDALVDRVINAGSREQLLAATHALDRVLLWSWHIVPHWHLQSLRLAYWDRFARVPQPIRAGLAFETWWIDPKLSAATDAARRRGV
ncbi:MAG: ABC transporter substrate-binding protein [Acetobacteraceae bacterium]|nr:ABC transporter substrate-binding protein [Acetobacteraceae bacterium]